MERASRRYTAKTGVGCDGFHPKVPLDLTKEARGGIVEFFEEVEQSGKWPQQACTTMFFLIPKNITSERPIELIRRNGGAQQTVGNFDLIGKICWMSKGRRTRSCGLGLGLGEGLRASQPACGLCLGDALQLPKKDLAGALWVFRAPEACTVRRMLCGRAAHDRHGCPARSKWGCLILRNVLQDALSEVTNIYTPLKF